MGRNQNQMKGKKYILSFLFLALVSLFISVTGGLWASYQYLHPDFTKDFWHFAKIRPIHVVSSVSWIVLSATGSIYYFLMAKEGKRGLSLSLIKWHFYIFLISGAAIYLSIITGKVGGREFFVFAPVIMIGILAGWVFFAVNYLKNARLRAQDMPVYYWMWGTGMVFMIYHLIEAHFWVLPYFRENFIRDFTIQWKSVGSFVGSWNQLVYGLSIYLMCKIKGDDSLARGKKVFFFYFLGLANLMFGWAHHIYILPTRPWVRITSYLMSMTEWVILLNIIFTFIKSMKREKRRHHLIAYKFMLAADFWIFVNLILALLISIPAINYHTHGTHITVTHTMGSMIGINTMILLSAILYISSGLHPGFSVRKGLQYAFALLNISLAVFLISLFMAGIGKSRWMAEDMPVPFAVLQDGLIPWYRTMFYSGWGIFISLTWILMPAGKILIKYFFSTLKEVIPSGRDE